MKKINDKPKLKVGIIGLGMVGTPLMRWFLNQGRQRGEDLFCYDTDPKKGYFDDIQKADIIFVCVPTPPNADGSCNTSIIESVVSKFKNSNKIIVVKSTVPPGTCAALSKKNKCRVLFNPEFLTEAQAWEDFINPDRQIVSHSHPEFKTDTSIVLSLLPMASFQAPGVVGTYNFYEVHSTEAELSKYGGNVFGAMKVAYSNILADFADLLGADYDNVRLLVGHDRRIGRAWMDVNQGRYRGFGGYCFPKDLDALIARGKELYDDMDPKNKAKKKVFGKALEVLRSVREYNKALLESQGLSIEQVSVHNDALDKKISEKESAENNLE